MSFKFEVGDRLRSTRKPHIEAMVMKLGTSPDRGDAYQLFIEGNKASGKFFSVLEVEEMFLLVTK